MRWGWSVRRNPLWTSPSFSVLYCKTLMEGRVSLVAWRQYFSVLIYGNYALLIIVATTVSAMTEWHNGFQPYFGRKWLILYAGLMQELYALVWMLECCSSFHSRLTPRSHWSAVGIMWTLVGKTLVEFYPLRLVPFSKPSRLIILSWLHTRMKICPKIKKILPKTK
jgi:hypothetical protein